MVLEQRPTRRAFVRALGATGVGAATLSGLTGASGGTITVAGGGEDIWNEADAFHYHHAWVEGDFDVAVHVDDLADTDEWAKAGLMVRQRLAADAENAMVRYTPGNGTSVQWRSDDGAETDSTTSDDVGVGAIEASWLRVVREGDTITGYGSTDGSDWTRIARLDPPLIDFAEGAYVGLAVTSHDRGTLCEAQFDSLSGLEPTENGDVGDVAVSGSVSTDPRDDGVTVEPGTYELESVNSGKVLMVADGSTANGATVQQGTDEDRASQRWDVQYLGDGRYRLTAAHSGQVLEVAGGSLEYAADVQQWPWAGYANQRWRVEPAGDDAYVLRALHSGQALDVSGARTDDGANVIQWPEHGGDNQLWRFRPVDGDDDGGDGGDDGGDTVQPTEPQTIRVTDTTTSSVTVDWDAATDDGSGLAEYRVAVDGDRRSTVTADTTTATVDDLDADTAYDVAVRAVDGAGNVSGPATVTATTDPADDGAVEPVGQFDPDSGFASTDWLDDDVDVYRIQEPTRAELERAVQAEGPRVVVFETSGTIDLGAERLNVTEDRCWIAGQTAPSPGITLIRGDVNVDADDCVVQHVRVRTGDADQDVGWQPDTIRTADGSANNVLDHVSGSWSVDEISSPGYDSTDTTFANCLFAEPLHDSTHPKGEHGCGTLVGDGASGVALLGNVWAKAESRQPRLKADTESVLVNNVMYYFDEATNLDDSTVATIEGNSYLRVDEDDSNVEDGSAYLADNVSDPETEMTEGTEELSSRPLWPDGLERLSPGAAREHVFANAGARPADRTAIDRRHVEEVRTRTGEFVDSQSAVGGYPSLPENEHTLDVPDSGLREWLQRWARAVESRGASPP